MFSSRSKSRLILSVGIFGLAVVSYLFFFNNPTPPAAPRPRLTILAKSTLREQLAPTPFIFKEQDSLKIPQGFSENDVHLPELSMVDRLSERLRIQRGMLEELSCSAFGIGLRGGFCINLDKINVGGNLMWDPYLSMNFDELFANQSVGDFGAGLGWYGRWLLRSKKPIFTYDKSIEKELVVDEGAVLSYFSNNPRTVRSWQGFDGAGNVEKITNRFVQFLDLTEEQDLPVKFDWVMSMEVGEHIPHAYEDIFVDNLARHACKGIVLSWAVEGQTGHHHVNTHNNDYVKKIMLQRGFRSLPAWELKLRSRVVLTYFINTTMVFMREKPLNHAKCRVT